MEKKTKSLQKVQGKELLDLLENLGILQEANRTFFHPISLNMNLEEKNSTEEIIIVLEESKDPKGVILHTVDKFKLQAFREYSQEKYKRRQELTGFIIQTKDMIREAKLETPVTPPATLRLQSILKNLDDCYFQIKKRIMEVSKDKDNDLSNFSNFLLCFNIMKDFKDGNNIDAAAKIMLLEKRNDINKDLEKIRQIDKDQKENYKEK